MERLGLALQRAQNTFNRNVDHFARELGLTGMQMLIIEYLASFSGEHYIYQKDIEHEFNIRKSTATNILHLMEQKDLITKKVNHKDTRLKVIQLTDKARKMEPEITSYFVSSEKETEKILGSEVKKELIQNLLKLNQILSEK